MVALSLELRLLRLPLLLLLRIGLDLETVFTLSAPITLQVLQRQWRSKYDAN